MDLLVRRIRKNRKGGEEAFEETVTHPVFTVGHRNDQSIQVHDTSVAPRHLVLRAVSRGRFDFKTIGDAVVEIDGKTKRKGRLQPGESIRIGGQRIAVLEPPPDFDGLLEVSGGSDDAAPGPETHFRTELRQTGLGTRRVSWLLFLAIPILFLVIPVSAYLVPGIGAILDDQPILPTDKQWLSGPLANVHHIPEIADNCNVCHKELFGRVPDSACLDCHSGVTAHVDNSLISVAALDARRCAWCHEEHNEPPNLVRSESKLCVACHQKPSAVATVLEGGDLPKPVREFTEGGHPQFRLALLRRNEDDLTWHVNRLDRGTKGLREQSNLKFPHILHLDPDKVTSLKTGQALQCADCHRLKAGGEHFVPITMEATCSGCHSLAFDKTNPSRQLPHGDVRGTVLALEEYFIRKYADPDLRSAGQVQRRRRPGRSSEQERCEGSALECGRQRAKQVATNLFTRSGCVTCHAVSENTSLPLVRRWEVLPVRLATDWYPFARFDHVAHLTQSVSQGDGEAPCAACHGARGSGRSADILIPGLANCLSCHGRDNVTTPVALTCRDCHGFHLPGRGIMRAARSRATGQGAPAQTD